MEGVGGEEGGGMGRVGSQVVMRVLDPIKSNKNGGNDSSRTRFYSKGQHEPNRLLAVTSVLKSQPYPAPRLEPPLHSLSTPTPRKQRFLSQIESCQM